MRAAAAAGLDVVALTDHDTTAGLAAAAAALPRGLTLVGGAEISCRAGDIPLHLLGYLFDPAEPVFEAARRELREGRVRRAEVMVERLQAAGVPVSWPQVSALAGGGVIGRPHVARALVDAGAVPDVTAAFGPEWIGAGGRFYRPKPALAAVEAVELIRGAGGVAVFAHPGAHRRGPTVGDETVAAMAAAGLFGLEVDHDDHDDATRRHLRGLASELGLAVTGGSDFHGAGKSIGLGAHTTDPASYDALVAQATGATVSRAA